MTWPSKRWTRQLIGIGSIVIYGWVLYEIGAFDFELERLTASLEGWGPLAAIASLGLMIAHSFLPVPAEIIAISNGILFGPAFGIFLTWLGGMIGAILSFSITRYFQSPLRGLLPSRVLQSELLDKSVPTPTLLIMRLIPLISFNLINYALGLSRVKLWTFVWTTALGILPVCVLSVIFGGYIAAMSGMGIVLSALGLIGFLCAGLLYGNSTGLGSLQNIAASVRNSLHEKSKE